MPNSLEFQRTNLPADKVLSINWHDSDAPQATKKLPAYEDKVIDIKGWRDQGSTLQKVFVQEIVKLTPLDFPEIPPTSAVSKRKVIERIF